MENNFDFILAGVKSIAFFFSAISTQGPRKKTQKDKDKTDDENGAESDGEPFAESQVSTTSSKTWISTHPAIINKKLRSSLSYWIALTTPALQQTQ